MTSQSNPGFRIEQNRKGISKKNKRIRISRQDCIQKREAEKRDKPPGHSHEVQIKNKTPRGIKL